MRRCAEQSNPPILKNNLLAQAVRYKGLMDAGFTIKPEDVPAEVMDAILILEDEKNKYKKKQQDKIERQMRSKTNAGRY